MTKERWQRVKELFHAANERPPEARTAFLAAETGDDASLRRDVESMLAMDADDASVLDGFSFRSAALSVDALMSGGSVQPAARRVLGAGHRIGSYEIVELLGAGAMGEVYRTRDTKLNREVALKVIPPSLAMNPDRLARFRREAQLLAALNHPNIAAIYGVEDAADLPALVLELIEGPTLAALIADGTLPLTEALRIARQIAEGLEAAHEQGIIHRDLKPSNIHVRTDGLVKILDFGLAKSLAVEAVMTPEEGAPAAHEPRATGEGVILGTAGYMSPEQARGQAVDKRGDIWAFGCVLFEMLAGRPAFGGETVTDVLAAIVKAEPEWSALPADLPPGVRTLLRRCLNKDSRSRLQAIGDARIELDEITSAGERVGRANQVGAKERRAWLAAVVALGVGVVGLAVSGTITSTPAATVRFEVQPPADVTLTPSPMAFAAQLALSPDGRRLAFVASRKRAASQLWIRRLDSVEAQPLPGTEGASFPFWSPDSRFIAFFADSKLKKIDTTGGVPQELCNAVAGRGGAWNPDGIIVFTRQANSPISRISSKGGVVTAATTFNPDQAVTQHYWPQFLADGRHFLYYQRSSKPEYQGVQVTALDSSSSKRVLESDGMALYASGHLVFVRGGTLFAQAFDDRALQTSGDPVRIGDHVGYWAATFGYAAVTVSPAGVLAHGPSVGLTTSLRWRDRSGASTGAPIAPGLYSSPRLSPDQKSVVVAMTDAATATPDLWVVGLARGATSHPTSDPAADWFPVWSADGGRLLFGSNRSGPTAIFQVAAGGGQEEPAAEGVVSAANATYPSDMSGDGRFLLYVQLTPRGYDLGFLTFDGERKASTFLGTPFNEVQGRFSPNSRWVAYASNESGRFQVYVRPFPVASGQTPIPIAAGMQPEWRRDGKELFYLSADGKLTAVPVTTDGPTFSAGTSHALFDVEVPEPNQPYPTDYAVTADGQRFLVNTVVDQPTRPALTVILNWTAGLKK